jgi:hypothetical protein
MNERIEKLREQAMEWVPNKVDPDTKIRLLNAEKFAELIVKECSGIVENQGKFLRYDVLAKKIKDHFEIKK